MVSRRRLYAPFSGLFRSGFACAAFLALPALLLAPRPVLAAKEFEKVGTIGAQFLKLPVGARGTAMGWAFTSIADDASAVFWNPAGLARLSGNILALNQTPWLADIQFSQATFITHLHFFPGTFGLNARSLYMPEDQVRTVFRPEGEGTSFDAGDLSVGLSYARSLTDKFSTGVGINYIQSSLAGYGARAISFDFGTLYDTGFRSLRIGMAITNIGSDMTFIEVPAKLPTVFRVGMSSYLLERAGQRVLVAGEFSHPPDNAECANAGIEYSLHDLLFLRGGLFFRYDAERYSTGAGFRIPAFLAQEARFDYSYTDMRNLAPIHRFSVEFRL